VFHPPATVYIIDDEEIVRTALQRVCQSAGLCAETFASVEAYLKEMPFAAPSCIISDVRMPGVSGFELPGELARAGQRIPVIYITANDTPVSRQRAHDVGASGFFRKPVDDQALLDAIGWAIGQTTAGQPHAT